MSTSQNTVATPLAASAFKLHNNTFNALYPSPLNITIEYGRASIKLESIFQLKYIPFLLIFVIVTALIMPGSCLYLIFLKLFQPRASTVGVVQLVVFIFLGTCTMYQIGTLILYQNSSEIEAVVNQIFSVERKCKNLNANQSKDFKILNQINNFVLKFQITISSKTSQWTG